MSKTKKELQAEDEEWQKWENDWAREKEITEKIIDFSNQPNTLTVLLKTQCEPEPTL